MPRFRLILGVLCLLIAVGCAAVSPHPAEITLAVPAPFATATTFKQYRAGQTLLDSPPYKLITKAPLTEYYGWYGAGMNSLKGSHGWTVHIYARSSPKVVAAIASATDGFQAGLNEGTEFLGSDEHSYLYARFEHKQFRWGKAVSFFSQSSQDTGNYVPNNGHLRYEVWGLTDDGKHTVVASIFVSHPKLADWGASVRSASSVAALKQDRDYQMVEQCAPEQFEPHLTAFDQMLDTLAVP